MARHLQNCRVQKVRSQAVVAHPLCLDRVLAAVSAKNCRCWLAPQAPWSAEACSRFAPTESLLPPERARARESARQAAALPRRFAPATFSWSVPVPGEIVLAPAGCLFIGEDLFSTRTVRCRIAPEGGLGSCSA